MRTTTAQAVQIVQGETGAILQPIVIDDVTDWRFLAQIRPSASSPTLLAQWLHEQMDVKPGMLTLPLDADVTSSWTWSTGVLGIEATSPDGAVSRVIHVPVTLDREVVRIQQEAI